MKNKLLNLTLFLSLFLYAPCSLFAIDNAGNFPNDDEWQEAPTYGNEEIKNDATVSNTSTVVKEKSKVEEKKTEETDSSDDEAWDPWEGMNRGIFWFNDVADTYFIGPIAHGYDFIMPEFAQTGVNNFFSNLAYPANVVSDLIRLDFSDLGIHTSRFLINSTLGIAGLFDVASSMGIDKRETDVGLALKDQGVPAGPYFVIPFIGPSTVRDGLTMGGETFIHPFAIMEYSDVRSGITDKVTWIGAGVEAVQTRVNADEALKSAKESSIDYYLFMRSAYYQYRAGQLKKLRREQSEGDTLSADDPENEEDWDF